MELGPTACALPFRPVCRLGGLPIISRNGLDAKNTTLRILCFSGQYCPISRVRAEIEADHRRFAGRSRFTLATNDTVSDHKTSLTHYPAHHHLASMIGCGTLTIIGKGGWLPEIVTIRSGRCPVPI